MELIYFLSFFGVIALVGLIVASVELYKQGHSKKSPSKA